MLENKLNKSTNIYSENKIVYKYLPIKRLKYLENELLRFTQPSDLNDPFECYPIYPSKEEYVDFLKKELKKEIEKIKKKNLGKRRTNYFINNSTEKYNSEIIKVINNEKENSREKYIQNSIQNLNSKLGILSLSRRWDSTLMWSHYTNSHKGFCIGFNKDLDYFLKEDPNSSEPKYIFNPVNYDNNRIKVPLLKGKRIDFNLLFTKSEDWIYENEERLLSKLVNHKIVKDKDVKIPIYLFKVPHSLIKEIIIGAEMEQNNINIIRKFCIEKNIHLYESKMNELEFNMKRNRIL